jgi:hypothetical protein
VGKYAGRWTAANQGVDWVLLTNGASWRVYHVTFAKPISHDLIVDIDFTRLDPKSPNDLELLYLWCKEGWIKSALGDYHSQRKVLSRFFVGATLLTEPVLEVVRRELRRVAPDVRIELDAIQKVLVTDVIKRDVLEGEKAEEASRKISRSASRALRTVSQKEQPAMEDLPVSAVTEAPEVSNAAVVAESV